VVAVATPVAPLAGELRVGVAGKVQDEAAVVKELVDVEAAEPQLFFGTTRQ
jgi:hypothetical protein